MMNTDHKKIPCDGQIPDGWQLPELEGLIHKEETAVHADFSTQTAPTPLVATLKILAQLPETHYFVGRYPQLPIHLFTPLEEDGWAWNILEQSEGSILLKIYRKGDAP